MYGWCRCVGLLVVRVYGYVNGVGVFVFNGFCRCIGGMGLRRCG